MKTLAEVTNDVRELLRDSNEADKEADKEATATRMGEALHEEGLSVETASPAQLTALLANSPDWTLGMIDGQHIH